MSHEGGAGQQPAGRGLADADVGRAREPQVVGVQAYVSGKVWVNNHAHVLEFEEYATRRVVEVYLNSIDLSMYVSSAAQPKLNQQNLNRIPVPIPPREEQVRIVGILDKFDALVNDISIGLPAELTARRKQYEHYRDRLLTFPERAA